MGNMYDDMDYVEIDSATGLGVKIKDKVYTKSLPDTIICNNPVELQEFYYFPDGKGYRTAYSCRPTVSINFNAAHISRPLKSKLHKHNYFELMLVASDQFEMQIESQLCKFEKWDICVLNCSTRHSELFKPEDKVFYLALSPEYLLGWPQEEGMSLLHTLLFTKFFNKGLRDTLQQNKDYISAKYTNREIIHPLHGIMGEIRKEFEEKRPGYQLFIRGLIYRLFSILADPSYYRTEYVDLGFDDGFSLAFSAKQILDKNKRKMTKLQIAECLNYSSEHINRVFKRHYGCTIPEYNRLVCIRHAAYMISNTNQHIHEICRKLGFTNRTHFYDLFEREYGCTPSCYRERNNKFI